MGMRELVGGPLEPLEEYRYLGCTIAVGIESMGWLQNLLFRNPGMWLKS